MALRAGLMSCEEAEDPVREAGGLTWVIMDSCGLAADLFRHLLEIVLNRVDTLSVTAGALSDGRCFL
jgi:hypothetical protein